MFCQKCGTENKDDAVFCNSCGAEIPTNAPKTDYIDEQINKLQKSESLDESLYKTFHGVSALPPDATPSQKKAYALILQKQKEITRISNVGAWLLIIIGLFLAIFIVGLFLIAIGAYYLYSNNKEVSRLNSEIQELALTNEINI
jgi:uncharacterized membrane protein YvbJ